jgi:parvulin-like peptidyl-prolyl isomerase
MGARRWFLTIIGEPLVHFFAIAAILTFGFAVLQNERDPHLIVISKTQIDRLISAYHLQFNVDPSPETLRLLVDKYVDEEILFREGRALRLDQDDEIVRRRIVQKVQFLQQDLSAPAEPSAQDLEQFYSSHSDGYRQAARVTFSHIFFARDDAGSAGAIARAKAALKRLSDQVTRAPALGDPFADLFDYANLSKAEIERVFGAGDFAKALFDAPPGRWVGPIESNYGWHLIRVATHTPEGRQPFAEIADRVRADWIAARMAETNARNFAAVKARYRIIDDRDSAK